MKINIGRTKTDLQHNQIELFRLENFSFRRLIHQNKDQVLKLLASEFSTKQPLSQALYKVQPQKQTIAYQNQLKFWGVYIDQCINSGLSVVAVKNEENTCQIVGVTLVKDYLDQSTEYETQVMKDDHFMPPCQALLDQMMENINPEHFSIFQERGQVIDIWGVAIKQGFTGKGLLQKMVNACCLLAKNMRFQYAFCFATNFKTGVGLGKIGFEKLSEIACRQFQFKGRKPFVQVEELHERPSVWLKHIE